MPREVERDSARVLGGHRAPHALEVREPARREPVSDRGLDVHLVERREVVEAAVLDDHAGLVGLLDVAAPELVEAGQQVGLGAAGEGHLEDVARLDVAESGAGVGLLAPAELDEAFGDGEACVVGGVGGHVAQALGRAVGDRGLEGVGVPGAHGDERAHLDGERADRLEVRGQRVEPVGEVAAGARAGPVDVRALGQVGEEPLHLRHLAQEHEAGADELVAVEPAEAGVLPLGLDSGPARHLQEGDVGARGGALRDVREVLLRGDPADLERRGHDRNPTTRRGAPGPLSRTPCATSPPSCAPHPLRLIDPSLPGPGSDGFDQCERVGVATGRCRRRSGRGRTAGWCPSCRSCAPRGRRTRRSRRRRTTASRRRGRSACRCSSGTRAGGSPRT